MSLHLPLLTASRLSAYRRCAREEKLRYQLELSTSDDSEALRFGTAMHKALEAWWSTPPESRRDAALAALRCGDPFEQARAEALIIGYDVRWSGQELRAVAVEKEFRLPLVNPDTGAHSKTWQLAGKIDAIAVDQEERCFVVEHKTTSQAMGPGSDYVARLRLDGQISMYIEGAKALGHDPRGVVYDIIGKIALRPYQVGARRPVAETTDEYRARCLEAMADSPERYFQRVTVVRLEDEVIEFRREIWQQAVIMRDTARTGVAPRNPDSCSRFNSMCRYFPLCTGEASQSSYTHKPAHSELSLDAG